MKILIQSVNANKLVDELQQAGLLEQEEMSFFPTETGLEIRLNHITETVTEVLDENEQVIDTVCVYECCTTETVIENIDGVDVSRDVIVMVPYTTEIETLKSAINACVAAHDPTPYAPTVTDKEKIALLEKDTQSMYEMMLTIGGIW